MKQIRTRLTALLFGALCLFGGYAQAGALSDFAENKIVDAVLRGQTLGAPATRRC